MKLVGATNWFIRWPFVIEGVTVGFFGAVAAAVVVLVLNSYLAGLGCGTLCPSSRFLWTLCRTCWSPSSFWRWAWSSAPLGSAIGLAAVPQGLKPAPLGWERVAWLCAQRRRSVWGGRSTDRGRAGHRRPACCSLRSSAGPRTGGAQAASAGALSDKLDDVRSELKDIRANLEKAEARAQGRPGRHRRPRREHRARSRRTSTRRTRPTPKPPRRAGRHPRRNWTSSTPTSTPSSSELDADRDRSRSASSRSTTTGWSTSTSRAAAWPTWPPSCSTGSIAEVVIRVDLLSSVVDRTTPSSARSRR